MKDDDAQERALSLLEEALQKAEMLLASSTHDQLLVIRSLLLDLQRLNVQLDGLRFSGIPQKVPDDEFWPVVSLIFTRIVELLIEKIFK